MGVRIRLAELDRDGDAVLAVQRAGYAVEARRLGIDALPAQHETVDDLRAETIWVAEDDGALELYRSVGFARVGARTVADALPYVELRRISP